jgi:ribosomal protein L34E
MTKIKRKTSKRKSKTRKNCIPCNPSMRGMRRINPESYQAIREKLLDQMENTVNRMYGEILDFIDQTGATPMSNEVLEKINNELLKLYRHADEIIEKSKNAEF